MIWRFDPFDEIHSIFRDIDNLFRRTLAELGAGLTLDEIPSRRLLPGAIGLTPARRFAPALDVFAEEGKLVVRCEVPGVDPNKINIEVIGNQLKISGEKSFGREVDQENFYLREATHGQFERLLTLPDGVKAEDIRATYENGVLEIHLPVEGPLAPRRVKIEVAGGQTKQVKAA